MTSKLFLAIESDKIEPVAPAVPEQADPAITEPAVVPAPGDAQAEVEDFSQHDETAVESPTFDEADAVFSQEEGYVLAAETLLDRCRAIESIAEAIKNVPEGEATPELIAVVQATILLPDEPAIASERFGNDDVIDVKAKGQTWDDTKSKAAQAAKVVAEAAKKVLQAIVEFLSNIWDWIVSSRRGILKALEAQKAKLAAAPQAATVAYTRRMKALTNGSGFGPQTATSSLNRYAEVLAACTYAIEDVVKYTGGFRVESFKPEAMADFQQHFQKRTAGAFGWSDGAAAVYEGEGGLNVSIDTNKNIGFTFESDAAGEEVSTTSAAFNRNDVVALNKNAITLLKGVEVCEPRIKSVQASLRKMLAMDLGIRAASQGAASMKHPYMARDFTGMFMQLRRYIAFATQYGVATAVKGAAGAAAVGAAFLAAPAGGDAPDAPAAGAGGTIEPKALPA